MGTASGVGVARSVGPAGGAGTVVDGDGPGRAVGRQRACGEGEEHGDRGEHSVAHVCLKAREGAKWDRWRLWLAGEGGSAGRGGLAVLGGQFGVQGLEF